MQTATAISTSRVVRFTHLVGITGNANLPALLTVREWQDFSGMSRARIYQLLSLGALKAKKLGRSTLIVTKAGIEYLESLPDAKFGPQK